MSPAALVQGKGTREMMRIGDRIEITACVGGYVVQYHQSSPFSMAGPAREDRKIEVFRSWSALMADLHTHVTPEEG